MQKGTVRMTIKAAAEEGTGMPEAPVLDAERLAAWLRHHMALDGLIGRDLAERSGLSKGIIDDLRSLRKRPSYKARRRSYKVDTLVALAHGLDMDLAHLLTKAGLSVNSTDRWHNFAEVERRKLAALLGADDHNDSDDLDARLDALPLPTQGD
jgi:hypothetical protein